MLTSEPTAFCPVHNLSSLNWTIYFWSTAWHTQDLADLFQATDWESNLYTQWTVQYIWLHVIRLLLQHCCLFRIFHALFCKTKPLEHTNAALHEMRLNKQLLLLATATGHVKNSQILVDHTTLGGEVSSYLTWFSPSIVQLHNKRTSQLSN